LFTRPTQLTLLSLSAPNQIVDLSQKWENVKIKVKPRRLKQGKELVSDGYDLDFQAFLDAYEALLPVVSTLKFIL